MCVRFLEEHCAYRRQEPRGVGESGGSSADAMDSHPQTWNRHVSIVPLTVLSFPLSRSWAS